MPRRGASTLVTVLLVLVLGLLLAGGCGVSKYNTLVSEQETVEQCWRETLNMYKRRADLVPQLVETVKGASNFEKETLTQLTEARASVGRIQLPENLADDPAKLKAFLEAQQGLSSALSRLLAVAENYPELKSVGAFRDLQSQLEGTENRIAVARSDYIDAVREYNTAVRRFPNSLIASLFGFERMPQLEIEDSVTETPKIDFGG
ncbi:MAG TPA: LemA family protein [Planctomycetes bacterium]|nr:LemA family protein [Planctomycetota bacterium]